ncbi:hypothetical protein ACFL35_07000 [Candidatus Riflebacteria bacterium]
MRGVVTEKTEGINTILFEDGQMVHFNEKSFPRNVKIGDVVVLKFSVNKSLTEKLNTLETEVVERNSG